MRVTGTQLGRLGRTAAVVAVLVLLAGGCGDDDASSTDQTDETGDGSGDDTQLVNACPEDGCTIAITDAQTQGAELLLTWDANFTPEVARNHIHVYWDTYEPGEVSGDSEARGVDQGQWVPTDDNPTFLTEGAVSVAERGESTTVCVTAADGEHSVLDEALEDCFDVSDVLPT